MKYDLDQKTESFLAKEKKFLAKTSQKTDLETAEVGYYEASLSFNIMIIHMAYSTIEQYKVAKQEQFAVFLKAISQQRIAQENELHGFFKFVLNYYKSA